MLAQVPVDSPYLMAMLDPLPGAVKEQMFDSLDKKVAAAFELSRDVDRSQLEPPMRAYFAMLDELAGKNLKEWGRELGFDPSGRFVLYGLGVWPVLRLSVANEPRMRQVITRMLAAAGAPTTERTVQGRRYWQLDVKWLSIVGGIVDGQAVFAVLPTAAVAQYLPLVLGLDKPARSLHASGSLDALIGRYQFLPTMIGYLDARFTADILAGRSSSSNTELDKPLRSAIGPISETCRADLDRLAGYVPRIVFGYHRLDTKGIHGSLALELPPSVVAALQRIRTAVPDLPTGLGARATFHVGLAANLDELLPLVFQLTTYVREHPFACPWFAPLGEAAAQLAATLDQPLPAALYGMRGMALVFEHLTLEPFDARGHAVIASDHANDLLNLVLPRLPGMSGIVVHPDARPVQLPLGGLGAPATLTGYAATRIDRAAIAVGPASASEVVEVLNRPPPKRSPLASFGFDVERMIEIGWLEPDDADGMRDIVLQLDIAPQGLLLEVYGTLPAR